MNKIFVFIATLVCFYPIHCVASGLKVIEPIALKDVKITEGPFFNAQQTNLNYILSMDVERLLAPYRREAGLDSKVDSYPNWENSGLDGHIGGHYLTALALTYASTGNKEVLQRLNYMIVELAKCQQQHGNGYLGAIPSGTKIWQEITNGKIDAGLFNLNDAWVPWYNVHKVFSGLRDAYLYTGNVQAKDMLVLFADWMLTLSANLSDQQLQTMLRAEYGGLNETLADVSEITGEQKYLQLAKRYTHQIILEPLLNKQDKLTGLHANTQIPKIVGIARIAQLNNDKTWFDSAKYFWQQVVGKRTVSIGGNSVREHFHPSDNFSSMIKEVEGPETCNTYNMLKLSKLLYQQGGDLAYIDYYERALYNHILSSQHPVHGGLVYFTPMRPNHYRVYSAAEQGMWCCVGSGIENHSKYGELIYATQGDKFYVNLFVNSEVNWRQKKVKISQTTQFPDKENSVITIHNNARFTLNIRYPAWVNNNSLTLSVNGRLQNVTANAGQYISLQRDWREGDRVEITLPMKTMVEQLPDSSNYYSILHGPIVLAAKSQPFENENLQFIADSSRMGHIAQGPVCEINKAPLFISNGIDFLEKIKPVVGETLTFTTTDAKIAQQNNISSNKALELIPFFRLHDSRYTLYFPQSTAKNWLLTKKNIAETDLKEKELARQTLDFIQPGQQQPESDHAFLGKDTQSGVNRLKHWRDASGWFSYLLNPKGEASPVLRLTYIGQDSGRRFSILINDKVLSKVILSDKHGDDFYYQDYSIPADLLSDINQPFRITFQANENSIAGGIYGIRLLKNTKE